MNTLIQEIYFVFPYSIIISKNQNFFNIFFKVNCMTILKEDTPQAFAHGILFKCFSNGKLFTNSLNNFINNRINIDNKIFGANNAEDFANEVIDEINRKNPNILTGDKTNSFEETIRRCSINYYNRKIKSSVKTIFNY